MPQLDVSFMCLDPMLSDTFDIQRRTQTVNTKGRAVNTPVTISDVSGVVTQREPSDLERERDGDVVKNRITICTPTPIYSAITGLAPDLITWNGMDYIVTQALPYSRFGDGVYEIHAESIKQPASAQ